MKSANQIKRLAKKIRIDPDSATDDNILKCAEAALTRSTENQVAIPATRYSTKRRIIMKSRKVKIAAAVVIGVMLLIPLCYGAAKALKHFVIFEDKFEYPEDNTVYRTTQTTVMAGDDIKSEEDAKKVLEKVLEEFGRLYREGKAEEIRPGVWQVVLSNGGKFNYGGDPEILGLSEEERRELLKKQFDEIHELKKAGKYEKTYKPEHDYVVNGIKYRYFEARYVLSDGTVKKMGAGEPVKNENDNED